MMRNLLIVDDEKLIRQGLKARIRYFNLDIGDIYEASDGMEALEIIKEHPINITIADIRMPDMDGLTLIKEAKKIKKNIYFIVLSGYAEFAYAEEAIRLGVKAYLLKPVVNEELQNAFLKIFNEMEVDTKRTRIFRMEKEKEEYLLEKEVNSFLSVTEEKVMDIDYLCRLTGQKSSVKKPVVYFSVIRIHSNYKEASPKTEDMAFKSRDKELVHFSVKNIFYYTETDCNKLIVSSLTDSNYLYAVYWGEEERRLKGEIESCFEKMRAVLEEKMNIYISQGAGRIEGKTRRGVEEANEALKQRMIYGDFKLYFYEDRIEKKDYSDIKGQIHSLKRYLERKDSQKIKKILEEIFCEERARAYGSSYLKTMWVRIMNMLFLFYDGKSNKAFYLEHLLEDFQIPKQAESVVELRKKMTNILLDCLKTESISQISSRGRIQLAMRYINDHYNEDISINDLARHYEMSPNYFSSIFKQETGQSAINYITQIRMGKAQDFLRNTNDSVVYIAKRVGYEDSQYFFRVFKKYVGVTPLKYREESK